jgi:hypothetical protein
MEIAWLAPTSEDYEALLDATTENFVLRAKDIKYCPHPDCVGVAKFNPPECRHNLEIREDVQETVGDVCTVDGEHGNDAPLTYEGVGDPAYPQSTSSVQPKTAHRFSFHCGSTDIHWPLPCQKLVERKKEVKRQVGEIAGSDGDDENYNDVAQKLWTKANTRPCPKVVADWRWQKVLIWDVNSCFSLLVFPQQCQAPIEKDDGCNHMTCRQQQEVCSFVYAFFDPR